MRARVSYARSIFSVFCGFLRLLNCFNLFNSNLEVNSNKMRYFHNWMDTYEFEDDENTNKKKLIHEHLKTIVSNKPSEKPDCENLSLYTGTAGIAYMFYHLSQIPALASYREVYLQNALNYINVVSECAKQNQSASFSRNDRIPGLLCGYCGIYALAAAIFHRIDDRFQSLHFLSLYHNAADICKEMDFSSDGSDELFVGRAGYILGALWLANETNTPLKLRDLHDICKIMVQSGRHFARNHSCQSPLMYSYYGTQYIGAAHGMASILLALISVPGYLENNPIDAIDIQKSIEYLLTIQYKDGNFPSSLSAPKQIMNGTLELLHWCHGAPGCIYLFAKAYLIWRDERYLQACEKCTNLIWIRGLLKKGPGLCHGISGNGYAFLLMYRLTDNIDYYKKAKCFEYFMETEEFAKNARTPDNPYSLFEGLAGAVCFIGDNLQPTKSHFPFQDIFMQLNV